MDIQQKIEALRRENEALRAELSAGALRAMKVSASEAQVETKVETPVVVEEVKEVSEREAGDVGASASAFEELPPAYEGTSSYASESRMEDILVADVTPEAAVEPVEESVNGDEAPHAVDTAMFAEPVPEREAVVTEAAMPTKTVTKTENPMQIVFVTSEVAPWSKTGGLADVCGSLPQALVARGHRVMVIAPRYLNQSKNDKLYEGAFDTCVKSKLGCFGDAHEVGYFHQVRNGVDYVFVDHPSYQRPGGLYGDSFGVYGDNQFRFTLLAHAACEAPLVLPFTDMGGGTATMSSLSPTTGTPAWCQPWWRPSTASTACTTTLAQFAPFTIYCTKVLNRRRRSPTWVCRTNGTAPWSTNTQSTCARTNWTRAWL